MWASVTFSESDGNKTLTINLTGTASDGDVTAVKNKMNNSSYTKVVVDGGVITDKFVQGIVYTDYAGNASIAALDLSKTSYEKTTFPKSVFGTDYRKGQLTIATLSLPSNIEEIGDEALQLSTMKEVVWPEGLKKIGKKAFCGSGLTDLELPANVEFVGEQAFWDMKGLLKIKLNSKLRIICAGAFGCSGELNDKSATQTVLQVPASVQFIGPKAFAWRCYQDVYFMGEKAPLCPMYYFDNQNCTAFSDATDHVYMGNSGFTPSKNSQLADDVTNGYANRENYYNGTYFTVMHYPSLNDTNEANKYRDQTRIYTTKRKEDGTFYANDTIKVGDKDITYGLANVTAYNGCVNPGYEDTYLGKQYIWPCQTQWNRAYSTASLGLQWNGSDKFPSYTTLTDEEKKILEEAGISSLNLTPQDLYKGTRQFVLANPDSRKGDDYVINMKGGKWWTLCVPFNMTKKQVSEVFGDKTNVCLFNKVERTISKSNPNNNKIHLYFTVDVFKHKCTPKDAQTGRWNYTQINDNAEPADDDIVIYAHESYMIHPSKTNDDAKFVVKAGDYDVVTGNPEPTIITSEVLTYVQDADEENKPDYRFIGNYIGSDDATATGVQTVTVPAYSYAYAKKKTDADYKFWFLTDSKAVWRANKCVVQTTNRDLGKEDEENFFGGNVTSAKQASSFGSIDGGNGDTTSIDEEYVIIAGEKADAPIYSVEGRMVSRNGDTTGLAKGVYIQNGNKFIVK